ncbi:hypothetical protein CHELA17_40166 [Chelatococcus asaccharovorans]|nr:hypothetical protein CHELA17_40166 [Chelatococcus asaccharovorans]
MPVLIPGQAAFHIQVIDPMALFVRGPSQRIFPTRIPHGLITPADRHA